MSESGRGEWGLGVGVTKVEVACVAPREVAILRHFLELFKIRPVRFGTLPAAAQQLFTKPWSRRKIEPRFEPLSWLYLKEKPQHSYEPGGLVNSLVFRNTENLVNPLFWTWTWLTHFRFFLSLRGSEDG